MKKFTDYSLQFTDGERRRRYCQLSTANFQLRRGVSLLDALMGAALLMLVFTGFFATLQLSVRAAADSKARAGAVALVQAKMEYLRSIPYADIGVTWADTNRGHGNDEDGYDEDNPSQAVPLEDAYQLIATKYEIITLNNITYERQTLAAFFDDAADGQSGHDTNHITNDYKVVRVVVSWNNRGTAHSISMQTNIAPEGIEQ